MYQLVFCEKTEFEVYCTNVLNAKKYPLKPLRRYGIYSLVQLEIIMLRVVLLNVQAERPVRDVID